MAAIAGANALIPVFDPAGLRARVENFDQAAPSLLAHLRHSARDDESARRTLKVIEGFPPPAAPTQEAPPIVVPLVLAHGGMRLSTFTTMTMLGTTTDTVLQSLRLETFFPANETSDEWFRAQSETTRVPDQ